MDEELEQPTHTDKLTASNAQIKNSEGDDGLESDEDEEVGRDWTKLLDSSASSQRVGPGAARPVIPKRGEKEFEPRPGGGSGLQLHILDRARNAMFTTLRAERAVSSKAISYAVWYPSLGRSHVTLARGIHFNSMGYSILREGTSPSSVPQEQPGPSKEHHKRPDQQKRLELLPEETIYLVERGSLLCFKSPDEVHTRRGDGGTLSSEIKEVGLEHIPGPPMTVQQVYSEMVGVAGLSLEKLQVYTYLRRLGYMVTRAEPPDSAYPTAAPFPPLAPERRPIRENTQNYGDSKESSGSRPWYQRFFSLVFGGCIRGVFKVISALIDFRGRGEIDWWRPIKFNRWKRENMNYSSLYRSLRFLDLSNIKKPLPPQPPAPKPLPQSPYKIFFNIYKPSTPFKKSAPGPPDFQIVVVNARTTPMPTIYELQELFDARPEEPLPGPKKQPHRPPQQQQQPGPAQVTEQSPQPQRPQQQQQPSTAPRKVNPFVALKNGKKMVVIAAVDSGNISFFKFAQGDFAEWPMM